MESFSIGLKLDDLDDFIKPSQECTKPIKLMKENIKTTKIKITDGSYKQSGVTEDGDSFALKKARITLNDCLACSGCITSAESLLIEKQSHKEFLRELQRMKSSPSKLSVVSISPQSIASLAGKHQLSMEDTFNSVERFLKALGVDVVVDIVLAREISLSMHANEFLERLERHEFRSTMIQSVHLPMFTSACPGWVCYAEKVHGSFILPNICCAKSPQQIMGQLVKRVFPTYYQWSDIVSFDQIYHATVMPCFDKKLEASRDESTIDGVSREVDIVLSTSELELLMEEKAFQPSMDDVAFPVSTNGKSYRSDSYFSDFRHDGTGSGGYLNRIIDVVTEHYKLTSTTTDGRNYRISRNGDIQEISIDVKGRSLHFAVINGFQNIQTVIQQLKRGKCKYHCVEIMACPSGCLNGGGQIRLTDPSQQSSSSSSASSLEARKRVLEQVKRKYFAQALLLDRNDRMATMIDYIRRFSDCILHTTYKEVPKMDIVNANTIKW